MFFFSTVNLQKYKLQNPFITLKYKYQFKDGFTQNKDINKTASQDLPRGNMKDFPPLKLNKRF